MGTKRLAKYLAWNGTAWVPTGLISGKAGNVVNVKRMKYSPDGSIWLHQDTATVAKVPPSGVPSASTSAITSSSMTVSWGTPSSRNDGNYYAVRYKSGGVPSSMTDGTAYGTFPWGTNSISVGGLASNTYYGYRIAGVTDDNQYGAAATTAGTTSVGYVDYYQEFGLAGVGAWTGSSWEGQSGAGRVRQSNSSGSNYNGYWFYGDGLKNAISGSTILNADIRFTRQASGSGPSGNVTVQIGLHLHTYRPANPGGWTGALPWTVDIGRGANFWLYGGSGGGSGTSIASAMQHIASDQGGAWRGLMCGGVGLSVNNTYISAGSSATDPANDPGGTLRVWYRKAG